MRFSPGWWNTRNINPVNEVDSDHPSFFFLSRIKSPAVLCTGSGPTSEIIRKIGVHAPHTGNYPIDETIDVRYMDYGEVICSSGI